MPKDLWQSKAGSSLDYAVDWLFEDQQFFPNACQDTGDGHTLGFASAESDLVNELKEHGRHSYHSCIKQNTEHRPCGLINEFFAKSRFRGTTRQKESSRCTLFLWIACLA